MAFPELSPSWSISGDIRGDRALRYLPPASSPCDEVMVLCAGVERADAYSGFALRSLLEYVSGRLLVPVVLEFPDPSANIAIKLSTLIGTFPNGVRPVADASFPVGSDRSVVMPAVRLQNVGFAELVSDAMLDFDRPGEVDFRSIRFLAAALLALADNGIKYAKSPVDVIACLAYNSDENEIQLVVGDLGHTVARHADVSNLLAELWQKSTTTGRSGGGLVGICKLAEAGGFDSSLAIHSGSGRMTCRAGEPPSFQKGEPAVPGFVASVRVKL
jgi:hypothetical protein